MRIMLFYKFVLNNKHNREIMKGTNIFGSHFIDKLKHSVISTVSIGLLVTYPTITQAADLDQASFNKAMDSYLSDDKNIEKISLAIQTYFNKKREQEAKEANKAEEKRIEEQFKYPVKIEVGDSPFKGPKDAKVTIVEFSDFQCPYCSRGKDIMEEVLAAYPKDVRVVFKHFPIRAMAAAKAAVAAQNQGKFWEMHDFLFENQSQLSDELYLEGAKKIGLNLETFKKDLADPKTEEIVNKDASLAKSLGVQGTPNFYINGVNLRGAYPLPEFKKIIDRWLEKK
jgi:protein-disulfide isomerase